MRLDQRDEFQGDAFDPFNPGAKNTSIGIQLQSAENYVGKGQKILGVE